MGPGGGRAAIARSRSFSPVLDLPLSPLRQSSSHRSIHPRSFQNSTPPFQSSTYKSPFCTKPVHPSADRELTPVHFHPDLPSFLLRLVSFTKSSRVSQIIGFSLVRCSCNIKQLAVRFHFLLLYTNPPRCLNFTTNIQTSPLNTHTRPKYRPRQTCSVAAL